MTTTIPCMCGHPQSEHRLTCSCGCNAFHRRTEPAAIVPPLNLSNPLQIRAYMARRGLVFNQLLGHEDPERGWVDPLDDDEVRQEVRLFLGRIWLAALHAENSRPRYVGCTVCGYDGAAHPVRLYGEQPHYFPVDKRQD